MLVVPSMKVGKKPLFQIHETIEEKSKWMILSRLKKKYSIKDN